MATTYANGSGSSSPDVGCTSSTNISRTAEELIRLGQEARAKLAHTDRFDHWLAYGRAVQVGWNIIEAQVGIARGHRFNKALGKWLRAHHLDGVDKATRS